MALIEVMDKIQRRRLILNGLGNRWVIVPRVTAPKPACAVQQFMPVNCGISHALRLRDQARVFFERLTCGEWHPKTIKVVGHRRVCAGCIWHGGLLWKDPDTQILRCQAS